LLLCGRMASRPNTLEASLVFRDGESKSFTGSPSTSSGTGHSTTLVESRDFLPVIGAKERENYLRRAEKESSFVAVYVMSRKGEAKTFIGTSISPTDIGKQLKRNNWEEVQVDLVAWTQDKLLPPPR
jgi:hypothetical protein